MNDTELQQLLKSTRTPERTGDYWQQFPRRVLAGMRRAPDAERTRAPWTSRLAWGLAAATACLVIGFAVGNWRAEKKSAANGLLQNEKVIREMMAMFPNRIRAIVQDERGLSLVLSEQADVPDSPPLFVQVTQGKQHSFFITFSGQEIEVAGQKISVLSDAKGSVMLVGDRFFWSRAEPGRATSDLRIEAKTLVQIL